MRSFISLLLLLCVLLGTLLFTVSCGKKPTGSVPKDPPTGIGGGGTGSSGTETDTIVVPPYKEYPDRATVAFSEIAYTRPDLAKISADFDTVAALLADATKSFEEQLAAIEALEDGYNNVRTMRSLATVRFYQDGTNSEYKTEYDHINALYPDFIQSVEALFVSAANSVHAERLEAEYFGEGLIETYRDGGIYTDEVVALLEEETALEAEFESLTPATVKITYDGIEDTAKAHTDRYAKTYGEHSQTYLLHSYFIGELYQAAYDELSTDLYVDLIKLRVLIAEAMGEESYLDIAYRDHGYEYAVEDMRSFLSAILTTVAPLYSNENLYAEHLQYQELSKFSPLSRTDLINTLYGVYSKKSETLADIYGYMLQFSLYDIGGAEEGRFEGSFTTYFDLYDAPFLFVSTEEKASDLRTLGHEFGHFADMFTSFGGAASLHLSETFSEALELLTVAALDGSISAEDYAYLKFDTLYSFLQMMTVQAFYAEFEHAAYALAYDEITEASLDALVADCADRFGFSNAVSSLKYVIIPHTVLYPLYVQSYCLSAVPALEIYFAEREEAGKGFALYEALLDLPREDGAPDFAELMISIGLSDPYAEETLEALADAIYYDCLGKNPPVSVYPPGNAA